VIEFKGYDVGAIPPVRHKTEKVVRGSGRINTLVEIDPTQIKRLTNSEVNDMSE